MLRLLPALVLAVALVPGALAQDDLPSWAAPSSSGPASTPPSAAHGPTPSLPSAPAAPVPLDGGLGLLAAAGAAYAARRLRARREDPDRPTR